MTTAQTRIEIAQIKMRYPTSKDMQPSWQVDYEKYGGFKKYTMIRNMYWSISRYYIEKEGKYNATNFPLIKCEPSVRNLLEQFRKDLKKPIHHYD